SSIAERFGGYSSPPPSSSARGGGVTREGSEKRQEKTDAVAKRMIAGALGIRAPKKTEEERAYERAVREGEVKRRQREREEKAKEEEERERARRSVWED
ncbi:hypothetical protein V490_03717, partial [Pseudogymnoascus sp. VKM F-3557]